MAVPKFYTQDDIEQAKARLSDMPDLRKARLTKTDVLAELKTHIISLYDDKGYTVEDIRSALESAGIPAGVKAIRDIVMRKKNNKKRSPPDSNRAASQSENKKATPQAGGVGFEAGV
jgi:hypothetical protein